MAIEQEDDAADDRMERNAALRLISENKKREVFRVEIRKR